MTNRTRRFFLLASILLCLILAGVLIAISSMAPVLRLIFVPYQFFLIGMCVGGLIAVTIGLTVERHEWTHYRVYFCTVMASVFLIVVTNSVIFKVLGGEQFIRRLWQIFLVVFIRP